jgi:hypothetical protein
MNAKSLLAGAALAALAGSANADLIISEIVDATLPGGLPKYAELTNTGASPVDLSLYSVGNCNNGGVTFGGGATTPLVGTLAPGASFTLCYEADPGVPATSSFATTYGFEPDFYMGGAFINGDDVVVLCLGAATDPATATIVDVYGDIGVDGTGQVWEYTDSYAYRCGTAANGGVFDPNDWTIPGFNTLEGTCGGDDTCELANILAETTPGSNPGCGGANTGNAYCFGDGTGATCPCAAFGGTGEGCLTTSGTGATLAGSGSATVAADTLALTVTGAPANKPGIFFQGPTQLSNPVGDGILCSNSNLRYGVSFTDASGTASSTGFGANATVGQSLNYQFWFRDTANTCGSGFNFSNGWTVTWN